MFKCRTYSIDSMDHYTALYNVTLYTILQPIRYFEKNSPNYPIPMTWIKAERKNFLHKMVQFYCRWRGKFEIENSSWSLHRSQPIYLELALF